MMMVLLSSGRLTSHVVDDGRDDASKGDGVLLFDAVVSKEHSCYWADNNR
jgi:hypothetical protein